MNAAREVLFSNSFTTYSSKFQKQCAKYRMKSEEINKDESKQMNANNLILSSILGYSCNRSSQVLRSSAYNI